MGWIGLGYGQFVDVSDVLGDPIINDGSPHGDGISFYDFNYDGWDDLTISNGKADPRFYVNNSGVLEPADFTIENTSADNISMMLWADYDNDGDADLLITKFGGPVQLWQNDGEFNFTDVAEEAGIWPGSYWHVGAAFADYNHDGCLDLYIAKFYSPVSFPSDEYAGKLYLNNCDGTFTDVTDTAGVYVPPRPCFQPVFLDYDGDGWEDLLLVIDRASWTNELFHNNGDGTFTNVTTSSGFDFPFDAMTGTVGDFDNDADLDVFLTNNPYYDFGNVLMENNGDGTFNNTAALHGVNLFQASWGGLWLDYDNDSWQDLLVTLISPLLQPIGNQFYVNNAGQGFTQQNELLGIATDTSETFVCAKGDLNNDGHFDFALNNQDFDPAKLYLNNGGDNNYLSVSLEGTIANRDGVGTWLHCYAGGEHFVRYTLCGENLIAQDSRKSIFGLGDIANVDSLVIEWNSGTREVLYNPAVNAHHHRIEGATFSLPFAVEVVGNNHLCPGDSVVLNAGTHDTYLWNTGWAGQYLTVTEPGEYWVTITNTFGLEVQSVPINIENAPEPILTYAIDDVSCHGLQDGSVWLEASTGPITNVSWSNGGDVPFIANLPAGQFSFTATDSYGCTLSDTVIVQQPEPLFALPETTDVLCFGGVTGSASASATGGTPPYFYDWFDANPNALGAGTFSVQVTDWQNCTDTADFTIAEPDALELTLDVTDAEEGGTNGVASLEIFGGVPPYSIAWSASEENVEVLTGLSPGDYSVSVTDFNGCTADQDFSISLLTSTNKYEQPTLLVYPNPFGERIFIDHCAGPQLEFFITDMAGRLVLSEQMTTCPVSIETTGLAPGSYLLHTNQQHWPMLVVKRSPGH